jgi:soluble P-type ATPase
MPLRAEIPDRPSLELEFLLLDVNGTLSDRGVLIEGVAERLQALRGVLDIRLLSADTFGTLDSIASYLQAGVQRTATAADKLDALRKLGPSRCVAVGNGANDLSMVREAALGIAVVGPEGASGGTVAAADIVCTSILDALDLLANPRALAATLRP